MALSDKNIVITPNIGQANDPKIVFSGADASTAAQDISLNVYPTSNGTLSFEGTAGQLFSITNDLTGTIFSVNDVSGIPSIEVDADGTISLAEFGGNVGIGTSSPLAKLDVNGSLNVTGQQRSNIVAVAALDVDCGLGNYFTKTISGNSTFTFSNVPATSSYSFILELTHTSGTVTWPVSVQWPNSSTPALTTGKTHLFVFITDDAGARWRGSSSINYVS